jgi:hypothetical protein
MKSKQMRSLEGRLAFGLATVAVLATQVQCWLGYLHVCLAVDRPIVDALRWMVTEFFVRLAIDDTIFFQALWTLKILVLVCSFGALGVLILVPRRKA